MSIVNVTDVSNTVNVTESGVVIVGVIGAGPQGPPGPPGSPGAGFDIDTTARVDKSVVYYDAAAAVFKADTIWTTSTLSDGGNF
jgi:hypothetical protein